MLFMGRATDWPYMLHRNVTEGTNRAYYQANVEQQ